MSQGCLFGTLLDEFHLAGVPFRCVSGAFPDEPSPHPRDCIWPRNLPRPEGEGSLAKLRGGKTRRGRGKGKLSGWEGLRAGFDMDTIGS